MKRIAFITDVHLHEPLPDGHYFDPSKNLQIVLDDVAKRGIQEVVFGGDIGAESSHVEFFTALSRFSLNLILGNHDRNDQVRCHFDRGADKDELYYKVEEPSHVSLFLDSSRNSVSPNQLQWLKDELLTRKRVIVYVHHPVLPIETPADRAFPLANRNEVVSLLRDHDREVVVFCGHYHMNDVQVLGNIRQICTQSMVFQLVKNSAEICVDSALFGYRIIELSDNKLDVDSVEFQTAKV